MLFCCHPKNTDAYIMSGKRVELMYKRIGNLCSISRQWYTRHV